MVVILGCGESGFGAAVLAKQQNISVFISDQGLINAEIKSQLIEMEIDFEEGGHEFVYDIIPEYIIKSPGIPNHAAIIKHFSSQNVRIISEIEFAYPYCNGIILAITGSNGKTTTTNLCHHLLDHAGLKSVKCGNVGYSFAKAVADRCFDYYVVEVSSFQLDDIITFRPHFSTILNITADHLDRYNYRMEDYIASKFRIIMNQESNDRFFYFSDDLVVSNFFAKHNYKVAAHEIDLKANSAGSITVEEHNFNLTYTSLIGKHNARNASVALNFAMAVGIESNKLQAALESFVNDPHRLELVGSVGGIDFINDSKATNVDSTYYALDAMQKKIVWIVGGQDKGNDYSVIEDFVKTKVKAIIALGADNTKILNYFSELHIPIEDTKSMNHALEMSLVYASIGDVVLLSPACASFDLFTNYKDRGDQFRNCVQALIN